MEFTNSDLSELTVLMLALSVVQYSETDRVGQPARDFAGDSKTNPTSLIVICDM